MFSHVMVGVNDFERALAFYKPVLDVLNLQLRFCETDRPWAGWQSEHEERPLFLIGQPFDKNKHTSGNGQMVAFLAHSRTQVHEVYRIALLHGGTCEGEPRLRPEYHAYYYGAYFRDPEGNKLCVACHTPA